MKKKARMTISPGLLDSGMACLFIDTPLSNL
jgi:hypothetical protein